MNAQQDHHALRHRPGGARSGRPASCTSTTACAQGSADRWRPGRGLHSRVVAILKVGLPLVALGLLLGALPRSSPTTAPAAASCSRPATSRRSAAASRISNPTFTGTTRGEDRFRFTAAHGRARRRAAAAGGDHPAQPATSSWRDGPTVAVSAATGDLDIPTQRLDLAGEVEIATSDGYRIARRAGRPSTCAPAR